MSNRKQKQEGEFKKIIRLAEADLDGSKKVEHALTAINGVSWAFAHAIRKSLDLGNVKLADLSKEDIEKIKETIKNPKKAGIPSWLYNRKKDYKTGEDKHLVSSTLELSKRMDIRRLKNINSYRGIRHSRNYKLRGQRTHSRGANVRGRKGGVVGVVRKKLQPQKKKKKKKE